MSEIEKLLQQILAFRDERDWAQFHDSKNLALALSVEAAELNELFLWKNTPEDLDSIDKTKLADELADVLVYALLLADKEGFDVADIVTNKLKKNGDKYPVGKSKGSSKKYTEL